MPASEDLAVVLSRVSSYEQLKSGSLGSQYRRVSEAARQLGVRIPEDGVWSGSLSSKKGLNFSRKDLLEILAYCKRHPNVKYLIVTEVDRFMRSANEQIFWEVRLFYEAGVRVYYADKPELNDGTPQAGLMRFLEGFKAEGSNIERQTKSITGGTNALKEGRYPYPAPAGYKKGPLAAIHVPIPAEASALKKVMLRIVNDSVDLTLALKELNASEFANNRKPLKMDKFKIILINPYYAGVVHMDKQVKFYNENGVHESLITLAQHKKLVSIVNGRAKNQKGPMKGGNPLFPLSNFVTCEHCGGRFVGFQHTNGKRGSTKVYYKYRCRSCGRYIDRDQLHMAVGEYLQSLYLDDKTIEIVSKELDIIWKRKADDDTQRLAQIRKQVLDIDQSITNNVSAAILPENNAIKLELIGLIDELKQRKIKLLMESDSLVNGALEVKRSFYEYAFNILNSLSTNFLEFDKENRVRCKQLIFPGGFYLSVKNKVYTQDLSPIYRYVAKLKGTLVPENDPMVRVQGL